MIYGRIYADLNKRAGSTVLLTTIGTQEDLAGRGLILAEGVPLSLWSDDADPDGTPNALVYEAIAHFDSTLGGWVGLIDWPTMRHER